MPASKADTAFTFFGKVNALWRELTGSAEAFTLESRIFHSITLGIIILAAIYIPYNLYAGLYISALSCLLIMAIFSWQFYNSRVNGIPHSSIVFGFTGIIIFSVNYFSNAGINGSTDLIWPAYLLLVFAVVPYRQQALWLCIYIIAFFILHLLAYYYPQWVQYPFAPGNGQFTDRITAFPIPAIAIFVTIKYIRRAYDNERRLANEKAAALADRNEQILLQTARLEQSNLEKSKLMSILSHDLRAPLVNIQNYLELLNDNAVNSSQRADMEKSLLSATRTTMDMLSNILSWSKTQMEGVNVKTSKINLLETLQGTMELEKMLAATKEITLSYSIPPEITIMADADMLQLVIRNLANNAIKFTHRGGKVSIKAGVVLNECRITVKDNGTGISAEKTQTLFTLKAEPTFGTQNERGAGLGLLLCKEFIERQGGRIGVETSVGKGSEFFVFMPLA